MEVRIKYIRHIVKVFNHKWFVLLAGLQTKAPLWRLIIHDLSKLSPSEMRGYAWKFYASEKERSELSGKLMMEFGIGDLIPWGLDPSDWWEYAWLHHQNSNPHHWEYWIRRPTREPLAMPEWAVREMVADWMAAGKSYSGEWPQENGWEWLEENYPRIQGHLNQMTKELLAEVLHSVDPQFDFYIFRR